MNRLKMFGSLALVTLLSAACVSEMADDTIAADTDEERTRVGKADQVFGSCLNPTVANVPVPMCGGKGWKGNCYCDELCESYGDCCADYHETCGDEPPPEPECVVSGCSGQICAPEAVYTTCEWRPEYACYQQFGVCEAEQGQCGWKQTPELLDCIADATNPPGLCGDLEEQDCIDNPLCSPIYGASCPVCLDWSFQGCIDEGL